MSRRECLCAPIAWRIGGRCRYGVLVCRAVDVVCGVLSCVCAVGVCVSCRCVYLWLWCICAANYSAICGCCVCVSGIIMRGCVECVRVSEVSWNGALALGIVMRMSRKQYRCRVGVL